MDNLFVLLQINDSMFPIGSFTQSYGLEAYVSQGLVKDDRTAEEYAEQVLLHSLRYNDAAFLQRACEIARRRWPWKELLALDERVTALKSPAEIGAASRKLAIRFLKATAELRKVPLCARYLAAIEKRTASGHHAIAFGLYATAAGIPTRDTLTAYYYNALNGIVTNCAKLVPISQMVAQRILGRLQGKVEELVATQDAVPDDRIGTCCVGQEIKCMQHEKQYTRLYIS